MGNRKLICHKWKQNCHDIPVKLALIEISDYYYFLLKCKLKTKLSEVVYQEHFRNFGLLYSQDCFRAVDLKKLKDAIKCLVMKNHEFLLFIKTIDLLSDLNSVSFFVFVVVKSKILKTNCEEHTLEMIWCLCSISAARLSHTLFIMDLKLIK